MKILVACEYSGLVREAFRELGHDAMSCDLLFSELPGPHYQGDVRDLLSETWDMIIAFPPCTYLSNVAACRRNEAGRMEKLLEAVAFVQTLWSVPVKRICIENPVGYLNNNWRKPNQIIQPWMFGERYRKRTCLWLRDLPPLMSTVVSLERQDFVMANGMVRKERAKIRSRTFKGVAEAMAGQWGG